MLVDASQFLTEYQASLVIAYVGLFLAALPWLRRDSTLVRKAVAWTTVALVLRYCWWRVSAVYAASVTGQAMTFSYVYVSFELYFLFGSTQIIRSWTRYSERTGEADKNNQWYRAKAHSPVVDFLIPTYNENYATLERAIIGGLSQDYENVRVWVLDDGRREWLKHLAEEKGVRYLTRPDNAGYKAGNLNHALKHISQLDEPSEFIGVMDCDFIAAPTFVRRALSLMWDETVAIVQTKQVYFNLDPFQYALPVGRGLTDWQRMAFEFDAPCRDGRGAQTCCGTCFLGRTSSFLLIGGVPTESVAEDRLTTYALNEHGLRTIYLNEAHSFGIVAEGISEFLNQCHRWCLGVVQNVHSRWGGANPRLSRWERFLFAEGVMFWSVACLAKVFQMWLPIVFWFFGSNVFPIHGTNNDYWTYFGPFWVFSLVAPYWLTRGTGSLPIVGDAMTLIQTAAVVHATYAGFLKSKNHSFVVTDKGNLRDRTYVHWRVAKWPIITGVLTLAGMLYAYLNPSAACHSSPIDGFAYFWSIYNLLSAATAIAVCVEPAQRRAQERFEANEPARITLGNESWAATVLDISVDGARLRTDAALDRGGQPKIALQDVSPLPFNVARSPSSGIVAVVFNPDSKLRHELIRKIYCDKYIKPIVTGDFLQVYAGVLKRIFI